MKLQVCERVLERSENDVQVKQKSGRIGVGVAAATKRLVYESDDGYQMCTDQGNDPRFLVHSGNSPYVVDTSDGTKKYITFDLPLIAAIDRPNQRPRIDLVDICFLPHERVLGIIYLDDNATFLFDGRFDFGSCRVAIDSMIHLDGYLYGTFLVNETATRVHLLIEAGPDVRTVFEIRITNTSLTLNNTIRLPFQLRYPIVRDDRLLGFRSENGELDTTMLVEVSLTDGTEIRHKVKMDDQIADLILMLHICVNQKLTFYCTVQSQQRRVYGR
ncbi:hypothetical protein M3Y95_00784400 [Aphelenchoides besseyi]|nr:hypothetical protein M3Y95_00784400 [Aphelenchoides besseyi]